MPDREKSTLIPSDLDRAPVTEALRRRLYDAVVQLAFPKHPEPGEIVPTFTPDQGELIVFSIWGRWFAVWRDVDGLDDEDLPDCRIWQVVRLKADSSRPEGVSFSEV